ncbi:efflux RND transporter periplasmic adaptor subunit [Planktosalinus lacus]|uniref:RND transporter n=1 Tax=Planktosalinus lacus TaxID=1526573 RepID=A0A8J2Y523_9FLAO|nr:efflux RND transporter periplasmic adaptor subunit [Planktosalinus lacus]GGD82495.1 RND transporter [Planktosalinus lacus]
MKNILYILFAISLLIACSDNKSSSTVDSVIDEGNLTKMKDKRTEVLASYDSIGKLLSQLEMAIAEKDTAKNHPLVSVFKIKDTVFESFITLQGNVDTRQNILIFPEYQGVLTTVNVKEGQQVSKGQLLAKIDDGGLSSQLAQLETQYELAKTTYERQQRLWDQKIGSEIQLLQAKTNMESTQSSVKQLRSQLEKTTIRAPFSGVIDAIITEQGQVVGPGGQALMRLVSLSDMYVKASVPESYTQSVAIGTPVKVNLNSIDTIVNGEISNVGSYINPTNRTFQVEVKIPNVQRKVKPNMMANLQINNYSKENAIAIPANAIQESATGEKYVYVLNQIEDQNAIVIRTQIETGRKNNGFIEVLSGLSDTDIIVKEGALTLKDGMTITFNEEN